jgi:hypothetical protein
MIDEIKDLLIVKDNFFDDKIYKKIVNETLNLKFENRSTSLKGCYQKTYFHVQLHLNHFAVKEVSRLLNNYGFNLLGPSEHNYFLSTKHEEATPHDDNADLNCLIYIKGNEIINSGTGFYDKKEGNYVLNRHIGFKENRALIFDSKIFHASLQFNKGAEKRYIMSNFFTLEKK